MLLLEPLLLPGDDRVSLPQRHIEIQDDLLLLSDQIIAPIRPRGALHRSLVPRAGLAFVVDHDIQV